MRCCVQNCCNNDSKKTINKSHGITFHKLPKLPDQSAAWLAALTKLGYRLYKCLLVCSEHFLPEDFYETRPNKRRVRSGAVPTIMAPVIQKELKVCRVCLALDIKMYHMKDFKLSEMFQNITGISVIENKGKTLERVCWECAARLTAAAAFRDKALLSDALLKDQVHIKESDIALLKQNHSYLKSPLSVTTTFISCDIECEHTISENKEIDNIFKLNDETSITGRKTKIKLNEKEIELEEHEPCIVVPVKTEIESDPLAVNNMRFQNQKSDTLELTDLNNTSPREDSDDEITNTEVQLDNNDKILREDNQNKVPITNDGDIIFVEDNDNVQKKPRLDIIGNNIDESSSEEDTHSDAEEVSVDNTKQKMSCNVGTMIERATITLTHFNNTSPREDSDDEIINTEVQLNNNDKILREDNQNKVPISNDGDIIRVEDNDNVEKKQRLDIISDNIGESSSKEETQSYAEEVSVNNTKQKMGSEVVTMKDRATIRNNESLKEKIIALKKNGLSVPAIAKETGTSITSINALLHRYNRDVKTYRGSTTLGREQTVIESDSEQTVTESDSEQTVIESDSEQTVIESDSEQKSYNNAEASTEVETCSTTVRRRTCQAGPEHKLKRKPERTLDMGKKKSKHSALHDDLRQRIIALKQEGMSISRIAYLLKITRATVRRWWNRWCDDGHTTNRRSTPKKRKTTPLEDQLLIERVAKEQTVHTPSLAKELGISATCVRIRLRDAGFKLKERKASVPLRSGRSHKVDDVTKQQIISMKHNGVPVTDIANQFRVTRTSVYRWWRRWCKENNIKTSDNNTSTTTEQEQSLAENTNVEKIVQAPSILTSQKSLWQKLPDVEFINLNMS